MYLLEQSCELAHFFLSSAFSCECCLRMDRPQPAVMVPSRENARFTMGELGTLFGLKSSYIYNTILYAIEIENNLQLHQQLMMFCIIELFNNTRWIGTVLKIS